MEKPTPNNYIEMEAPEQLQPGQNFYAQPPFEDLFRVTGGSLDAEKLGRCLTYLICRTTPLLYTRKLSERHHSISVNPWWLKDTYRYYVKRYGFDSSQFESYREVTLKIGEQLLDDYPYSWQYIRSRLNAQDVYLSDGTLNPRYKSTIDTPTYAKWVTEKLRREKNQVLKGIEEVFPQDFGQTEQIVPNMGESRQTRKWRILKASNLVPNQD